MSEGWVGTGSAQRPIQCHWFVGPLPSLKCVVRIVEKIVIT